MNIAIHHTEGDFFSKYWIKYCEENNISYKLVNAYSNTIINDLENFNIFLWHHSNYDYRDALFAKQLLFSLAKKGIKVFPDFKTNWHFDDKVGQKYLLEAIKAPLIKSYVFYTKKEALEWLDSTSLPKVFKLRGGSGSSNVKLITTRKQGKKIINKAFGAGFEQFDRLTHLQYRFDHFKSGKENFIAVLKGLVRLFIGSEYSNSSPREKGYVYFQDFIPQNNFDTRVVVINGKFAAAERRFVRKGDFRASGSGNFSYEGINLNIIKCAFEVSKKLDVQSVAFDFVLDTNNKPLIVEISYGFGTKGIRGVPGYWDDKMNWYNDEFKPEEFIMEAVVQDYKMEKSKLKI